MKNFRLVNETDTTEFTPRDSLVILVERNSEVSFQFTNEESSFH